MILRRPYPRHFATETDRNGAVTTYTYDGLGRMLTTNAVKGGVNIGKVTVGYTLAGLVRSMSNDGFSVTYTYDTQGRLTNETESGYGSSVKKNYTYDIGNNRTGFKVTHNGFNPVDTTYEYDELGRLKTVKEGGVEQASYTYDTNGNRKTLTEANGVVASYEYNLANMVTSLQNKKGTAVQSSFAYAYYLDGNQKSKTDNAGRITVSGQQHPPSNPNTKAVDSACADQTPRYQGMSLSSSSFGGVLPSSGR